ncbi:MAG: thiamine ABC transporter substrate-binding protein [Candidatus Kariarchaeaceae archaeon]|jgi:thiamine transport system substrate-binding protein
MTTTSLAHIEIKENNNLTIYTYDSLFAYPEFDFVSAFENYAGLEDGSVTVVRLEDAGSIVTKAVTEKNDPIADLLIGIDNVLVHKAREENILQAYQPVNSSTIKDGLVDGLASDYLLTPYDYGVISLWYDNIRIDSLNSETFTLETLKDYADKLIVQNPALSSPGLGFLLWTIAIYGDESVEGVIDGNWVKFWEEIADDVRIVDSWGTAVELLYTEEAGRPMMVSYASSPSFGSCTEDDYTTSAILSNENNKQWGWQQIEGIGLTKNAKNPLLAKEFIDWFVSYEVQNEVLTSQWIYPAIDGIEEPDCYSSAIAPETITPLNSILTQDVVAKNIDDWLDRWELAIVNEGTDIFGLNYPFFSAFLLLIIPIKISRNRRQ